MSLDSIQKAIEDIQNGKMIVVVDDENRENEGDLIMAAEFCDAKDVNFMATQGKGLICAPLSEARAKELDLNLMIEHSKDHMGTAFTVSIDAKAGIRTGISASDRAKTLRLMTDEKASAQDFVRPGHIFPLIAKNGGVLKRPGHTEASVDLCQLAGLSPIAVICEILKDDGECARLPDLKEFCHQHSLTLISIEDLITYKKEHQL